MPLNPPESSTSRLADLLLRWEESRDLGKEASPEELCAGSPELVEELKRKIHILKLMDPVLETGGKLDATVDHTSSAGRPADPGAGDILRTAQLVVPGFRILGILGRGGMGVVYRAQQLEEHRQVALKMIRTGRKAPREAIARFRREAQAISSLQHPNIVRIFEVGEYKDQPYLVLEVVDGGTLAQKLAGKPMPPLEAACLVEALARAMHHAHTHSIMHRDLKPSNVLLTRDGTPKLSDFGLAKPLDEANALTRSGTILGTPCYMSPEQALGRGSAVGLLTDIYGLGTILYESLTGRPPFLAATAFETLKQVEHEAPIPPSQRVGEVPANLEAICLRCLEKDPARRYPSALALAEDLQRFCSNLSQQ